MYLLAEDGTAAANPYYRVEWALYPNLAMDLLVPQGARLIGVENATRLFLWLAQLLVVSGAVALEFAVKRRVHLAPFAALMFLYCLPFTWGFLNFEFGLGVALWGIAAMLVIRGQSWALRLACNGVFVVLLFAAHFFALGVYGAVLGWLELWRAYAGRVAHRDTGFQLLVLAAPAAAMLAVAAFSGGAIGGSGIAWHFEFKPLWLFAIFNGYSLIISAASAVAVMTWLYVTAKRRVLRFAPAGAWMAAGFALLFLVLPSQVFSSAFADLRVLPAAALVMPAFLDLRFPDRRWLLGSLACVSAVTLTNLVVVCAVWGSYQSDYAEMIASFGKLEPAARVLVADSGAASDPPLEDLIAYPMYHAPVLAVHYAQAFVPTLFTAAGEQPVRAQPDVARLDVPYAGPAPMALLAAIAAGNTPPGTPLFVRAWPDDYDYLYVLGPHTANAVPVVLEEAASGRRFVLYRIRAH
jgi:hypothetical protein